MDYPKLKAAVDEVVASLVRRYGEQFAEFYIQNSLTPTDFVEKKPVEIPVSKDEEAKK